MNRDQQQNAYRYSGIFDLVNREEVGQQTLRAFFPQPDMRVLGEFMAMGRRDLVQKFLSVHPSLLSPRLWDDVFHANYMDMGVIRKIPFPSDQGACGVLEQYLRKKLRTVDCRIHRGVFLYLLGQCRHVPLIIWKLCALVPDPRIQCKCLTACFHHESARSLLRVDFVNILVHRENVRTVGGMTIDDRVVNAFRCLEGMGADIHYHRLLQKALETPGLYIGLIHAICKNHDLLELMKSGEETRQQWQARAQSSETPPLSQQERDANLFRLLGQILGPGVRPDNKLLSLMDTLCRTYGRRVFECMLIPDVIRMATDGFKCHLYDLLFKYYPDDAEAGKVTTLPLVDEMTTDRKVPRKNRLAIEIAFCKEMIGRRDKDMGSYRECLKALEHIGHRIGLVQNIWQTNKRIAKREAAAQGSGARQHPMSVQMTQRMASAKRFLDTYQAKKSQGLKDPLSAAYHDLAKKDPSNSFLPGSFLPKQKKNKPSSAQEQQQQSVPKKSRRWTPQDIKLYGEYAPVLEGISRMDPVLSRQFFENYLGVALPPPQK
jgi:hypothetical protein